MLSYHGIRTFMWKIPATYSIYLLQDLRLSLSLDLLWWVSAEYLPLSFEIDVLHYVGPVHIKVAVWVYSAILALARPCDSRDTADTRPISSARTTHATTTMADTFDMRLLNLSCSCRRNSPGDFYVDNTRVMAGRISARGTLGAVPHW